MSDIYGFLVGIEQYDQQQDWAIAGPCANAIAIADWLLSIGVPGENIALFLDTERDLSGELVRLGARNVRITKSARSDTIDTFWRVDLACEHQADSKLLVFWSGHGFTANDGSRIFYCRDYTERGLTNRVFNASNFLRHLHTTEYAGFAEQISLADVCGVYSNLPFVTAPDAKEQNPTQQIAYFATPEGKYAKGNNGRGVFTNTALGVLAGINAWPDPNVFVQSMEAAFKHVGQTSFRIGGFTHIGQIPDYIVGSGARGKELFSSVFKLLSKPNLPDAAFRPHYLRTINGLGRQDLANAQGLTGMVAELTALRDGETPGGLVEFLVRLAQQPELRPPIEEWLDARKVPGNPRTNARRKIDAENFTKLLVVEVQTDIQGKLSVFQAYLKTGDMYPVPGFEFPSENIKDWSEFRLKFLVVFNTVLEKLGTKDFQIHFVADLPLLDYAFHRIQIKGDTVLGEDYVVVLHCRHRNRFASVSVRAWERYANELRLAKPDQLKLVPLPSGDPENPVPNDRGLCYLNFILQASEDAAVGGSEKRLLRQLLSKGVPYLCWGHNSPAPAGYWGELEKQLSTWLGRVQTLDEFPEEFSLQRFGGNSYATQATLLWDDPEFNPFLDTTGVSVK